MKIAFIGKDMFQSLTGSIHTVFRQLVAYTSIAVSIPHRFNSHGVGSKKNSANSIVSIPHRFNSHPNGVDYHLLLYYAFKSLTGSIHTNILAKF